MANAIPPVQLEAETTVPTVILVQYDKKITVCRNVTG